MRQVNGSQLHEVLRDARGSNLAPLRPMLAVLFVSDPVGGDAFHIGPVPDLVKLFPDAIPESSTGSEITDPDDLLARLDFAAYGDFNAEGSAKFDWLGA